MNINIQDGWILSMLFLAVSYLPLLFSKKGRKRLTNFSWINNKGKKLSSLILILFVIMLIIPVFHAITEISVQLYFGISIMFIGIVGVLISYSNYFTTSENQVITKGMYRFSRNPIYFFTLIMCIGMGVLCTLYEMLPILFLYVVFQHPIIKEEERYCAETYGEEYLKYKRKTPRYFLIKQQR